MATTWKFISCIGRNTTNKISGITIAAYTTQSGTLQVANCSGTTNQYGELSLTTTTWSQIPSDYYWRASIGNLSGFEEYDDGNNAFCFTSSTYVYGRIDDNVDDSRAKAFVPSNYNSNNPNGTYSMTVYVYLLWTNIMTSNYHFKYLTKANVFSMLPPKNASSFSDTKDLTRCVTFKDILLYAGDTNVFKSDSLDDYGNGNDIVNKTCVIPYESYYSGTTDYFITNNTSLNWDANDTNTQTVKVWIKSDLYSNYGVYANATCTNSFSCYLSSATSSERAGYWQGNIRVYPRAANSSTTSPKMGSLTITFSNTNVIWAVDRREMDSPITVYLNQDAAASTPST